MAIEYTWSVSQVDYTLAADGTPETVTTIHWRCTAKEGESSAASYGTVGVPEDDPIASPAAASVEADVISAAQRLAGQADIEQSLANNLGAVSQPVTASGRLWDIPVGTAAWRSDVAYAVGDVAVFNGIPYTCIQAHTSQRGWTPPNVPALWSIQNQGGSEPVEWVAGEAVNVGDQRIYQGVTYEVIQSHTIQAGWEPPNVPALWIAV